MIGSPYVHLVLSNAGDDDGTNVSTRQALHESHVDITDRMLPDGHIGHNKFVVYADNANTPRAVPTGSTNWTANALCGQTNNALIIESPEVATIYLDYWRHLKDDNASQSAVFRENNNVRHNYVEEENNIQLTTWFSPNTQRKTKPTSNPPVPSDLQEVFELMHKAEKAIIFLVFQPGSPSVIEEAKKCQDKNPNLIIRGAATDRKAVGQFDTDLFHRSGKSDGTVIAVAEIDDEFSFWQKELLKVSPKSHAVIHDKIVVIDPFSSDCAVITGSHNLGFKASYSNDENLIIARGNRALSEAYAIHVMDVYDHYRWRFMIQQKGKAAWSGLNTKDTWQDRYFIPGRRERREIEFWTGHSGF